VGAPITLCLSGGGFRATIFHLGVIDYLAQRDLLGDIRSVYGVSGGAITAAHLAHHWTRYSDRNLFCGAALELLKFVHAGVIDQIVWSNVLRQNNRTERLAAELNELFSRPLADAVPATYLVCSSIRDVSQFGLELTSGILFHLPKNQARLTSLGKVGARFNTATAVAMSASFPLVFEPMTLDTDLTDIDSRILVKEHSVADGGIVDNLGLQFALAGEDPDPGHAFLVSDARQMFDDLSSREMLRSAMLSPLRTIDYLLNKNSAAIVANATHILRARGCTLIEICLAESRPAVEAQAWDVGLARAALNVRTNFDAFSINEIIVLYRLGILAADKDIGGGKESFDPIGLLKDARLMHSALNTPWSELRIGRGADALSRLIDETLRKPGKMILGIAIAVILAAAAIGIVLRAVVRI
jgi:predicted acylesterase/phospholipase RssA